MLKQQVKHGSVHSGYAQQELYLMSRLMPYQPMKRPGKDVTQEDMWKTLARHAKPDVQVQTETQSPQAKKEPLKWLDPVKSGGHGQGYMLSECGRFSIAKVMHELGYTYCAWDLRTKTAGGGMAMCLGCERTKEAAMKLCEAAR